MGRVDFRGSLFRQSEGELLEKKEKVRFGMGVAGENDFASIGGGQMDIEHLQGGELFEDRAWGESAGPGFEAGLEGDLKAVGQEGDNDVGFDTFLTLVVDGPDVGRSFRRFWPPFPRRACRYRRLCHQ